MNYEDPNYNVSIPVFTIHGNHDDPAKVNRSVCGTCKASCLLLKVSSITTS